MDGVTEPGGMQTVSATDYHDIAMVRDPRLSPDGERVAFVRQVPDGDEEYEATIHVVPLDGGEPRRFTVREGVDGEPRWSPSGDRLAFVSTRGTDDDRPQLWVLPVDGGEAEQVTDVVGGVAQPAWRPDGGGVAFVQSTSAPEREAGHDLSVDEEYEREPPDPRVIDRLKYRADTSYHDGRRSHVYVADLADDSVERLTDGDRDHSAPTWGDERTCYYLSQRAGDPDDNIVVDVLAHDLASGAEEQVLRTTGAGTLAATADGRLAYTYTPEDRATLRQTDLKVHDRTTGETTTVTADLDRTVTTEPVSHRPAPPKWGPEGEFCYFLAPDEGDVTLRRVRGDGSRLETVVESGHVTGFDPGRDAVAYALAEWDHPGDIFASTPAGAETNRLTRVNADYLDGRAIRQPEEVWFDGDEGPVQGWLLTPPDFEGEVRRTSEPSSGGEAEPRSPRDPNGSYPLVVEIHGGPHTMWTTTGSMWHEFQALAARGYVVFWSNPRGSTGYGEAHAAAIERDWGAVTLADVLAGVDAVCEREYVDEENCFVTGGSFGGFMTAWAVTRSDRFRAAVAQRGVYDLSSFYGSTDAFKLVEWDFGTLPWEEPEFLWEQSPVARADGVETPTLVVHSDHDYRVPVNNAEMLYLFLKKAGVDTRLVRYPREGHELSRSGEPGHVVDRIERIARWFDGYSDHHDAPPALERESDADLTAGEE